MNPEKVEIKIIEEADEKSIVELYKDAGWWNDNDDPSFIKKMIKGSFCFAGAFDNGKMIGMGRAISDGVSDAYIQDVVVLKSWRKKGVGGKIIQAIVQELQKNHIDWIGLIGEPGTENFYSGLGFKRMRDYIPMKLD